MQANKTCLAVVTTLGKTGGGIAKWTDWCCTLCLIWIIKSNFNTAR